jgi:hypothetical protein
MKAITFILSLILIFTLAVGVQARSTTVVVGAPAAAPAGLSCTGGANPIFQWSCENLTVTSGTPAGCVYSGGDASATANSAAVLDTDGTPAPKDGSVACSYPTANDRFVFDVSSSDIVKETAGTVIFYFRLAGSVAGGTGLFKAVVDATNFIKIAVSAANPDEIVLQYEGDSTTSKYVVTTDANIAADTWYQLTAKWSLAGVSEAGTTRYLSLQICDVNGANCSTKVYLDSSMTAIVGNFGTSGLWLGEIGGIASASFGDLYKIYDSWQ